MMVSEKLFVADCDKASVTVTVKVEVPILVGVPDITPVELSVRFVGSAPEARLQTRGPTPPLAWRV